MRPVVNREVGAMRHGKSTIAAWLLAMALTGAVASHAAAQDLWNGGFVFQDKPKMNYIPNTDVYYERKASGYDRYRYANTWYLVDDGVWFRSFSWQGPYVMIDMSDVPDEVTTLPGNYRRYWVAARPYGDEDRDRPDGSFAWPGSFSRKPSMHNITASGVAYSHKAANGNVDLYRFRSSWYLVDAGEWYRADSWKGPFFSVTASSVPREVLRVPSSYRRHWIAPARY